MSETTLNFFQICILVSQFLILTLWTDNNMPNIIDEEEMEDEGC